VGYRNLRLITRPQTREFPARLALYDDAVALDDSDVRLSPHIAHLRAQLTRSQSLSLWDHLEGSEDGLRGGGLAAPGHLGSGPLDVPVATRRCQQGCALTEEAPRSS